MGENTGGGGIFLAGGAKPTRLTNVTLSANQSNTRGGGIFVFSGILSLNAATVTGNSADANGNGNGTIACRRRPARFHDRPELDCVRKLRDDR